MVWPSLDSLVRGWVQRSYLKPDGWWAQLVLDEFAFLEQRGYSLTASDLAGVHFHQKGHYVWFTGPGPDVVVSYDPEAQTIDAETFGQDETWTPLDAEIRRLDPQAEPPTRRPLSRDAIAANVRWWAAGLRAHVTEILGPAPVTGPTT